MVQPLSILVLESKAVYAFLARCHVMTVLLQVQVSVEVVKKVFIFSMYQGLTMELV